MHRSSAFAREYAEEAKASEKMAKNIYMNEAQVGLSDGYMQTELGMIPNDWEIKSIDSLVDKSSPICYGVVQVGKYSESGIPIVAIKYVKEISHAQLHRTAIHLEQPFARSRPKGGDILISVKGTIGRVGIVPNGFSGNISRELARLRICSDSNAEYVSHQLEAETTQDRIMKAVVGTTRLEFSIAAVRQFRIPIPKTLNEQRAIASALSDVDALLAALDRLITKKRDLKQATMQQLLTGKTRLPGFQGEWKVKPLMDIISYVGSGKSKPNASIGDLPLYGSTGIIGYRNVSDYTGDAILVARVGANAGALNFVSGEYCVSDNTIIVKFNDNISIMFFQYQLTYMHLNKLVFGSGQPLITGTQLKNLAVFVPNFLEQCSIAGVINDMSSELSALEQRLAKTRALKQGMMQELLTGRIRLVTPQSSPKVAHA